MLLLKTANQSLKDKQPTKVEAITIPVEFEIFYESILLWPTDAATMLDIEKFNLKKIIIIMLFFYIMFFSYK